MRIKPKAEWLNPCCQDRKEVAKKAGGLLSFTRADFALDSRNLV